MGQPASALSCRGPVWFGRIHGCSGPGNSNLFRFTTMISVVAASPREFIQQRGQVDTIHRAKRLVVLMNMRIASDMNKLEHAAATK